MSNFMQTEMVVKTKLAHCSSLLSISYLCTIFHISILVLREKNLENKNAFQ